VQVQGFLNALVDGTSAGRRTQAEKAAYDVWLGNQVAAARRTIAAIDRLLPDHRPGTAAHRYLSAWRADVDRMARTFGAR
jgi:hypothetical protein